MVDGVIVLYEQNETNFTSNGLGYLSDVIECTVSEELNGEYELEMEYPVDGIRYSEIQHRRILYVKPNPYEDPQPFRIYNINRPIDGRVEINARHISYDLSGYTVSESENKSIPFSTSPKMFCEKIPSAMTELNSGMPQFTFWTNSVEEYDSETYAEEGDELKEKHWIYIDTPSSVRSLIGQFTEKYKGEFKFDKYAVKFYGPVSGQSEDDKHYRGTDSGVVLRYGKNLTDLMQEEDSDKGMYTHLYPYWSGTVNTTNTDSESNESSSSTTYSSRSEEKVVTMTNKLYPIFDHDVGYKRVLIYEVNSDWNEKHPNNTNDATPWPAEEDFEELCKEYIKNNELGIPKITLTASFIQLSRSAEYEDLKPLEKVLLGDTVSVLWEELGVDSTLKCTKTEYDALMDSYKSITLGNDANASISSTVAATSSGLSGVTSSMSDKVSKEEFYNQTYDTALSTTSTNAVQNKVVTSKFNEMKRCCNEVKGEIEYLKEFVSRAGGTLSYGTDIPTGGEDGDGYVQVAQGGGSNPVTLTVGSDTGNWAINNFTPSGKKYSFTVAGTGNPQKDIANINATNLIPDHEYRVVFTAKMSSNATYYNHGDYAFGVNVAEYNSLIIIGHNNITRGTYDSSRRYQSFYEDNVTHDYSFTFRTGANEDKVSLSFSFHDVRDDNPVALTVTNFAVSSTSGGDNEIVDLWFKIDGEWLKYQVDNESVFTYGTANPNSNTEGDIYAKIHGGSRSPYTQTLDLSKAICSSSYPSYGIAKFENGEIILKITSAGNYYENSAAAWKQDLTNVSSIEATCYHTILGSYGVCLGVGTRSKLHDNETGPVETRGYIHDEIVGYHSETIDIPINQEFTITTDVSSLTGEHYIGISTDINEELHITDVKMHLINPEPELVIDDIFYKIDGEWKTEDNSGGSTVSVTPIQTTGTHIADIEVDGVIAELYAPTGGGSDIPAGGTTGQVLGKLSGTDYDFGWINQSGGSGGGGGVTRETIWTGNAYSGSGYNTTTKPITDYDLLLCYHYDYPGVTTDEEAHLFWLDPKRIADNNYAVNYYDGNFEFSYYSSNYLRGKFTNATTFIIGSDYSGGRLFRIDGIKLSGGGSGGGGGIINDILYSASSSVPPSAISLAHPYTDYDYIVIDAFAPYSNELVYAFGNVYPTGDLEIGLEIGATNNDYWCWYTITDNQTLTVSAVHSSPTFYIKSIRGIKLSGGGSGGGVTRETIYTGAQRENTITLSKSITNYEYLILQAVATVGGGNNYYNSNILSVSDIISSGTNKVGVSDDIAYLWYNLNSNTSLSFSGASGDYYIKSIEGIKLNGGSGGGSERTDLLYSASGTTAPNTITLAHPYTDYKKLSVTIAIQDSTGFAIVNVNEFYIDDLSSNRINHVGGCGNTAAIWYTLDNSTTLTFSSTGQGFFIKSIRGIK